MINNGVIVSKCIAGQQIQSIHVRLNPLTIQRKLKDAGRAAEPPAKSAWGHARDGAISVGHSVKSFFASLFSN